MRLLPSRRYGALDVRRYGYYGDMAVEMEGMYGRGI